MENKTIYVKLGSVGDSPYGMKRVVSFVEYIIIVWHNGYVFSEHSN